MLGQIVKAIGEIFSRPEARNAFTELTKVAKKGHHSKAISEGLRKGSSEAGKVMAKWRWK